MPHGPHLWLACSHCPNRVIPPRHCLIPTMVTISTVHHECEEQHTKMIMIIIIQFPTHPPHRNHVHPPQRDAVSSLLLSTVGRVASSSSSAGFHLLFLPSSALSTYIVRKISRSGDLDGSRWRLPSHHRIHAPPYRSGSGCRVVGRHLPVPAHLLCPL